MWGLAASDADEAGRDAFVGWLREARLEVVVDQAGTNSGLWSPPGRAHAKPVMIGWHIDTVIDAGIYDGCIGAIEDLQGIS